MAGLFSTLFSSLLGPRRGAVAAAAGIIFYTLLVGANPSVARAATMGCLGLLANQPGRRQAGLPVLDLPGYPLLRTDQSGWIEVSTDGKQMWVEVEKK